MSTIRSFGKGPTFYYCIFRNQNVGRAILKHPNQIDYLEVREEFRGKGFGSKLLKRIEKDVIKMSSYDTVQIKSETPESDEWVRKKGYQKSVPFFRWWREIGGRMNHFKTI